VKLSSSLEAASCVDIEEFPNILWNPKIHCRVHKSPTLVAILIQVDPVRSEPEDFNKEIKNMRYDPMVNGYPQEFVDFILKPLRSNRPSSGKIFQGTAII
jgi:hypothetical protein